MGCITSRTTKANFNQIGWYETGRLITAVFNRYGEIVTGAIKGVCVDGEELLTRTSQWSFSYKGETGEAVKMKTNHKIIEYIETEGVSKKHGSLKAAIFKSGSGHKSNTVFFFFGCSQSVPWTCVNNCILKLRGSEMKKVKIKNLKESDFFARKEGAKTVFVRGKYDRAQKKI